MDGTDGDLPATIAPVDARGGLQTKMGIFLPPPSSQSQSQSLSSSLLAVHPVVPFPNAFNPQSWRTESIAGQWHRHILFCPTTCRLMLSALVEKVEESALERRERVDRDISKVPGNHC